MTKFKKTFATALTLALVFGVGSKAFADEDTDSLFNILTTDIAENQEDKSQEAKRTKIITTKPTLPTRKNSMLVSISTKE